MPAPALAALAALAAALLAAAPAAAQPGPDYFNLDEIPGIDFVGFGYDARFEEAKNALTVPLMEFSYTQGKQYIYPPVERTVFRVPNEIFVRTVAFTEADAYSFNTIEEIRQRIGVDVGFGFEESEETNNTDARCITTVPEEGGEPQRQCNQTGFDRNARAFSIGANVNYLHETLESDNVIVVENAEKTQLYNLFLDNRFLRSEVRRALNDLLTINYPTNPQPFFKFLEKYGTHYVTSAVMGGQVKATSTVSTQIKTTSDTFGVGFQLQHVTEQQAMRAAQEQFQRTISVNVDFQLQNVDESLRSTVVSNWLLLGGDANLVDLLDGRDSAAAILTWKSSITSNPIPVGYRLREVATLIDDPVLAEYMRDAIRVYFTRPTDDIIEINLPAEVFGAA